MDAQLRENSNFKIVLRKGAWLKASEYVQELQPQMSDSECLVRIEVGIDILIYSERLLCTI